ncbi:hypothetical protein P3X46_024736 [Hevea brasiliensis]|uniref:Glutamine amidotransferase domain-containing protein n=1 Tax=Hevea brasiliensis TaxID=3981 RepID=A0ABQ9L569_HEVBR|nr:gamma-glutamyl peptidase 5 [Hevea brasiliensis]KAJ9159215.1 hypothetical protein P3X46_024736 [Hevea brasiliensis]
MGGKKFAVLLCAEDPEYVKMKYGGYFGVFLRMLGEEGETWDVYKVACGEFPDDEEIKTFDGFVITGSCNDAHGNDVWILKLLILLQKLNSMKKKILGICFGHQILARSLGGKTGPAVSGWDMGITTIHFSSSTKLFSSVIVPASLAVIECHRDEVRELPPEAEVIAWSDKTGIEMFRYEDHIMGIQGHPEYNRDILSHLVDRLLQRNLIVESFADEIKANLDGQEPDKEAWKKLCTNFLKGRLY